MKVVKAVFDVKERGVLDKILKAEELLQEAGVHFTATGYDAVKRQRVWVIDEESEGVRVEVVVDKVPDVPDCFGEWETCDSLCAFEKECCELSKRLNESDLD